MKKISIFIIILILFTGCDKKEDGCCTCLDCPNCDVCCSCSNPYLNK